ncbi:ATP-dependent nuclease [Vagococcus fessus]|uniref:Uncharacterized protein n=1 Tax=Vagococcus fessus TaxID=120370 RepID=A0A430A6B4_9ENTE|nr:ATP-dependent endonuclease [Vagococcus fessus]RSU02416.1 hypothetical protein CBF31_08590 [Vagococcus fessus]
MNIKKVKVKNFRLLKDFELDFREDMSLVVGKNNCGKTSVMTILDKLLSSTETKFSWNDFNLDYQKELFKKIKDYSEDNGRFEIPGITMQVFIEYFEKDSYENIQNFMMNLDPKNNIVVLEFFYSCKEDVFKELKLDLGNEDALKSFKKFSKYMTKHSSKYFTLRRYSREFDMNNREVTNNISNEIKFVEIRKLIDIKIIKANREASNKVNDSTLSSLSQKYFNIQTTEEEIKVSKLEKAIDSADKVLSKAYNGTDKNSGIFTEIFNSVNRFGSGTTETNLRIESSISEIDLLKNNTTLFYKNDNGMLPESYNGLGYLNLIGMIFEIETSIAEFCGKQNEAPSDINILFIEEPEAHTHPQLQYVFIKNIKELLTERKIKNKIEIQTVITTHSSHIVSECEFEDVRYFKKDGRSLVSKNFQELQSKYKSDDEAFNFVKQYLSLNRSELFFTEKAVFIEGDTERILLPAMMKKIDLEHEEEKNYIPLLSQNISIIEVGAHAHTFKHLMDFLGIKILVISDIDGVFENGGKACPSNEAKYTSNYSLRSFFGLPTDDTQFKSLVNKNYSEKTITDRIRIAYQTCQKIDDIEYQPRSFEDAFICLNFDYINSNRDKFTQGLKNRKQFDDNPSDFYKLAQNCIEKKSAFATEILFYDGKTDGKKWEVPGYIKEGLEWLQQQ